MSTNPKGGILSSLSMLAEELGQEKTAAARKQAEAPTPSDPGGYQGPSTHPTTTTDNRGQSASEGSRSSENSSDVKDDQGSLSVDSTSEGVLGSQDEVQLNIGMHQSATGEDPSVENDFKGGKDDPGTTHEARTDNDSLDGHKYASAEIDHLVKFSNDLSNSIMADLATGRGSELTKTAMEDAAKGVGLNPSAAGDNPPAAPRQQGAGAPPAGEPVTGDGGQKAASVSNDAQLDQLVKQAAVTLRSDAGKQLPCSGNVDLQKGYELAGKLGLEKQAAQSLVSETVHHTIKEAMIDADLLGAYLCATKKAMDEDDGEDHNEPGDDSSGASATDGVSGEGEGDDSPSPESGGDAGGPPAAGGPAGGGDPIAEMLGGGGGGGGLGDALGGGSDPGGMMPPPGGPTGGGEGLGGGGQEAALMQLVAALDELGIPLEELAAGGPPPEGPMGGGGEMGGSVMGEDPLAGGPPAGGPPAGGPEAGMPPAGGAPPMSDGMKLASAAKAFRRSGKYRFKEAGEGTPERQLREQMKSHILELLNR